MRETLKNNGYYESYLRFLDITIEKFNQLYQSTNKGKGAQPLRKYYLDKIKILYFKGAPIEEIKEIYPRFLDCFLQTWTKDSGYEIVLNVVSLAVLLEVKKEDFTEAIKFLKKENVNDYVLDFLLNSIDNTWKIESKDIKYPIRYAKLKEIIDGDDPKKALEDYLKQWYELHKDAAWYDSHKSREDIYTGYWSFEAGALSKILNIEDDVLKEEQYYPYDMVHFKGEES